MKLSRKSPRNYKEERFGFEPKVTARVVQAQCRVYECAISYNPRTYEEGKKIGWKDGIHALYCIFHYSAHAAPLPMQILIYLFIGAISLFVNLAFFVGLTQAGMALDHAIIVSFAVSALCNYLLCIAILFRHKARWNTGAKLLASLVGFIGNFCCGNFLCLGRKKEMVMDKEKLEKSLEIASILNFLEKHREHREKIFVYASIGIVVMSVIVIIIMYVKCRSLWLDEASLARSIVSRNWPELLVPPLSNNQSAPVLYVIAVKLIGSIFGYSDFSLRIFSFLAFIGLLVCETTFLKRVLNYSNYKTAFVVVISALLPAYIWYSNELKPYISDAFFVVLTFLLYFYYTQDKIK